MYSEERPPDDPPPTLELQGVSPLWRILAVAAFFGLFLLTGIVALLLVALADRPRAPTVYAAPPAPPPFAVAAGGMAADDDLADGAVPYPVVQDLAPPGRPAVPKEEWPANQSPRRRDVLARCQVVWTFAAPLPSGRVLVSPDGQSLACVMPDSLSVGQVGALFPLTESGAGMFGPAGGMALPPGMMPPPGGMMGMPGMPGMGAAVPLDANAALPRTLGGWDGASQRLYWTGPTGRVHEFRQPNQTVQAWSVWARAVAPLPDGESLVVVRDRPGFTADVPGRPAAPEPVEVVLWNRGGRAPTPRTLIAAGEGDWRDLAVSPDGQRLALLGRRREGPGQPAAPLSSRPWQVYVLDLKGGRPRPVSPAVAHAEGLCWRADSQGLFWARDFGDSPHAAESGAAPAVVLAAPPGGEPGVPRNEAPPPPPDAVPPGVAPQAAGGAAAGAAGGGPPGAMPAVDPPVDLPVDPPVVAADTPGRARLDLAHIEAASGRETRLTHGGGFAWPSITADGRVHFLVETRRDEGLLVQLVQAPLKDLLSLPDDWKARDEQARKDWTALAAQVLQEAGVTDPGKTVLDERTAQSLAEAFQKAYGARFKSDVPTSLGGLEVQRQTLHALGLPAEVRARLALILAAVEGETLCARMEGSRWLPAQAPARPAAGSVVLAENDFALACNPLRPLDPSQPDVDKPADKAVPASKDNQPAPLETLPAILARARGRTILLTTDSDAARKAVEAAVDPDLARGRAAFAGGKPGEGQRFLLAVSRRHERNGPLTLAIGQILLEQGRKSALRDLMLRHQPSIWPDPRLYNLLGLALADTEPQAAVDAFKNALRCDLAHGPAWLNLARAYAVQGDLSSAHRTLRRFLKVAPDSPLADDARRRLAELADNPPAGGAAPDAAAGAGG